MRLFPEMTIGELDGPSATVFGRVTGLDVGPDGQVLVVDAQAREVRLFSAGGEHMLTIGGPGEGPGEFSNPDQARFRDDGRIVVRDLAGRFSVFTPDGTYQAGWARGTGHSTNARFYVTDQGEVVNPSLPGSLVSYGLDGVVRDTLPFPTKGHSSEVLQVSMGGGMTSYPIPFMPSEQWTMDPRGRFLFGVGDRYAIERVDADGEVLRIERLASPAPVSGEEAGQLREQLTRAIRQMNDPDWRWDGPEIPSIKPMFQELLPGTDGTIWVLRERASVEVENPNWDASQPERGFPTTWERPNVADVFDPDGSYLGPVVAPRSMSWMYPYPVVSRSHVWGVAVHELGHQQVVRFRVAPTRD